MGSRPLRILHFTSVFPRWTGDATPPFVLNLCRDLAANGLEISVLAPHAKGAAREEKMEGVAVSRFPYFYPPVFQTLCYEGGMNVRLRGNKFRNLLLPFYALAAMRALRNDVMKNHYDIVHSHSLLPQTYLATRVLHRNLPLVSTSHGADLFQLTERWRPRLLCAARRADRLIANSRYTAAHLVQLVEDEEKVSRIPASPNFPDPAVKTHQPADPPVLLFMGRLIEEKGVDQLIEAMPEILSVNPELSLRIAGSGSLESFLRRRVSELSLEKNVRFLGWLSPEAARKEMQQASLLVAPSCVIEGQNLVVTEAFSVGCPVICTPSGGLLDLVEDGKTGTHIRELSPAGIASAVRRSLLNPEERAASSDRAFERFQNDFSRKSIVGKTRERYEGLCSSHP